MRIMFGIFILLTSLAFVAGGAGASLPPDVQMLTVEPNPLSVEFQVSPKQGVVHTWYFGDGTSATGDVVQHTYARQGGFFVTLESNDGGLVTSQRFWAVAGNGVELLDFESGLPVDGWVTTGLAPIAAGAINGDKGAIYSIVNPNPAPSCAMPIETPPDENPLENEARRWLLSALVDLDGAPVGAGSNFDLVRIFDVSLVDAIFGVHFLVQNGEWHALGFAREGLTATRVETTARAVGSGRYLVELEVEIAASSLGLAGLRVSNFDTGQEVVDEQLGGLDNGHLTFESFDFGVTDGTFPGPLAGADIKLDDFRVVTDACLQPSALDLLAAWDFEDSSQVGWDSSGGGRHGTVLGTASVTTGRTRPGGIVEQALDLDGAGYLEVPSLGFDFTGQTEVTVEAWVKVANHSQMNLFRAQQPLAVRGNGISVSNYGVGGGWESLYASPDPPTNQWYHLATVFDQGELRVYIDGVEVGQRTLAFTSLQGVNYATWALGARVPGGAGGVDQFFVGQVDDVRIFTRVLSPDEIRSSAGFCGD